MSSHIGHIVMTTHFLVAGILLAYVAIGIDPKPTPLPFWGRMMLVLAAIILHLLCCGHDVEHHVDRCHLVFPSEDLRGSSTP